DAAAANLLEHFREAKTIVRAVIAYSRQTHADPERTLEDSLPLLRQLVGSGLLLPEGAQQARPIEVSFADGAAFGPFQIIRCIQVLEDSEIYQARDGKGGFAALKIARRKNDAAMQHRLDREAVALERLAGAACPPLLDSGSIDGQRYLAMRWV